MGIEGFGWFILKLVAFFAFASVVAAFGMRHLALQMSWKKRAVLTSLLVVFVPASIPILFLLLQAFRSGSPMLFFLGVAIALAVTVFICLPIAAATSWWVDRRKAT